MIAFKLDKFAWSKLVSKGYLMAGVVLIKVEGSNALCYDRIKGTYVVFCR